MSLFAFDACFNFCLLSPSTGFFLFFVAQKGSPYFWCPHDTYCAAVKYYTSHSIIQIQYVKI